MAVQSTQSFINGFSHCSCSGSDDDSHYFPFVCLFVCTPQCSCTCLFFCLSFSIWIHDRLECVCAFCPLFPRYLPPCTCRYTLTSCTPPTLPLPVSPKRVWRMWEHSAVCSSKSQTKKDFTSFTPVCRRGLQRAPASHVPLRAKSRSTGSAAPCRPCQSRKGGYTSLKGAVLYLGAMHYTCRVFRSRVGRI